DVTDVEDDPSHSGVVEEVPHETFDPSPAAVGVADAVLDGRTRLAGRQGQFPCRGHELEVLGVYKAPAGAADDGSGLVAEDPFDRGAHVFDGALFAEAD